MANVDNTIRLVGLLGTGGKEPTLFTRERIITAGACDFTLSHGDHGIVDPVSIGVELISAAGTISTLSCFTDISANLCSLRIVASPVDISVRILIRNY